jgi:hypothetical protein
MMVYVVDINNIIVDDILGLALDLPLQSVHLWTHNASRCDFLRYGHTVVPVMPRGVRIYTMPPRRRSDLKGFQ